MKWILIMLTVLVLACQHSISQVLKTDFTVTTQQSTSQIIPGDLKSLTVLSPTPSPSQSQASSAMEQIPGDATSTWLTVPNFPLTSALATNASAALPNGLALSPGATNAFSLTFGPQGNIQTGQQVRDTFFLNYLSGNQTTVIGSPIDTGQGDNNVFAAVVRHYNVGDPNDVHLMADDGLHLRAMCSNNHKDCSPGKVWSGMIRLPFEFRPGMTLKVRYKSPLGDHSWASIWMFSGSQKSPGPGGNPYQGFGTPNTLIQPFTKAFEIDWNDNFSRVASGSPTGTQLDYGTPDIYGIQWGTKPHFTYWANGSGYTAHTDAPPYLQLPFNWGQGFHDLVGNWRNDGSNLIDLFVDGTMVAQSYMEYPADTYVDPTDGKTKTVAMTLMIANTAIPSFSLNPTSAIENDGLPDGWTIVLQEISAWYGNIQNPESHKPN